MDSSHRHCLTEFIPVLMALSIASVATAQESFKYPEPRWPTEPAEINEVIVENVYYYRSRKYTQPITLWPVKVASQPDLISPETALGSLIQAMGNGDFETFLRCWTSEDRRKIVASIERNGRDAKFVTGAWSDIFRAFPRMELIQRRETLGRVILTYLKRAAPGGGRENFQSGVVFVQDKDGQWRATNSLMADPVFLYAGTHDTPGRHRHIARKIDLE